MISYTSEEISMLDSGIIRLGLFFYLATDPEIRLWLGAGSIRPGVNVYDPGGTGEYKGLGEITDVPPFKQITSGAAERVEFTISGVSGDILSLASAGDAQSVKGKRVAYGFALMGSDWSLLGPVHWCANYTADYLSISQQLTGDPDTPIIRTITLSCGTILTGRNRPGLAYWTNKDQQARYPGDLFCSLTPRYAHQFNKTWPTFTGT